MRKTILIFMIFSLLMIVGSCKTTPSSPVVVGKDLDKMIDKVKSNSAKTAGTSLEEMLQMPEKMTFESNISNGRLKISSDAKIVIPNVSAMPVVRVGKKVFSQEDVSNFYQALVGDSKLVSPASVDDFIFKENTDPQKGRLDQSLTIQFMPDQKTTSEICLNQGINGMGASGVYMSDIELCSEVNNLANNAISPSFDPTRLVLPKISQADAQKLATTFVSKVGLEDFVCTADKITTTATDGGPSTLINQPGVYEFMFTRLIHGVPITYTNDIGYATIHDAYFEPWMYESIRIFVDDSGIMYLIWNSPYEVKDTISPRAALIPFANVQEIFKKMVPMRYDYYTADDRFTYEMEVTQAHLGLMRITEKDVGDSGLIVPVWDFYGKITQVYEQNHLVFRYDTTSLLTINAIDGTVIDRELGY